MSMGMFYTAFGELTSCKFQEVYIYMSAWASALLILGEKAMRGLTDGISDRYRFPRFFYIADNDLEKEPSGSGTADIFLYE